MPQFQMHPKCPKCSLTKFETVAYGAGGGIELVVCSSFHTVVGAVPCGRDKIDTIERLLKEIDSNLLRELRGQNIAVFDHLINPDQYGGHFHVG